MLMHCLGRVKEGGIVAHYQKGVASEHRDADIADADVFPTWDFHQ